MNSVPHAAPHAVPHAVPSAAPHSRLNAALDSPLAAAPDQRLTGLPPVIAPDTRLVILGSFPGVASLQAQQYYGHPRNHFWPLVGTLLGLDLVALPYADRLDATQARGLGLWDVYAQCRREGSLDSAIEYAALNDLASLPRLAPRLRLIAHNGGESARAMRHTAALGLPVLRLPSSSPANASWSFARKLDAWRQAFEQAGLIA
ncbi:MAG: DNA-deoxyinosine glycosylase [Rubrivivax sp.]|nr:DNA-deoxyinosine glycosylase [Rubrivivax sp.]